MAIQLPSDSDHEVERSGWKASLLSWKTISSISLVLCGIYVVYGTTSSPPATPKLTKRHLEKLHLDLERCRQLSTSSGPPAGFPGREGSDRFEEGTRDVLLRNATVWTGNDDGKEVLRGAEVLLSKGVVQEVSGVGGLKVGNDTDVYEVDGAWLTPGLIDLHSHMFLWPSPIMGLLDIGATGSIAAQPYLRSVDSVAGPDVALELTAAGGVTSALILPGSAHPINGQAFVFKMRSTKDGSPDSMLVEPSQELLGVKGAVEDVKRNGRRWRNLKFATGENPDSFLGFTRMETIWTLRESFMRAKDIKDSQNSYCERALGLQKAYPFSPEKVFEALEADTYTKGGFPYDAEWEALVALLRGWVKLHIHCYTAGDFSSIARVSREFEFEVAAFHHSHEAYTVPAVINSTYGATPAVALFSIVGGFKRESFFGSPLASSILEENGIDVVIKSDHGATPSGEIRHQAGHARHFGMSWEKALASITTTPARRMGLEHRIGYLNKGYDADVVLWDSHPLALGSAAKQVWVDGMPQLQNPTIVPKPASKQDPPPRGAFEWRKKQARALGGFATDQDNIEQHLTSGTIAFTNIATIYGKDGAGGISEMVIPPAATLSESAGLVIRDGVILCMGSCRPQGTVVDLKNGTIAPPFIAVGSQVALGNRFNSDLNWNEEGGAEGERSMLLQAVDGLTFGTKDARLARLAGVAYIVPVHPGGVVKGLSTYVSLGAAHGGSPGAIKKRVVSLHAEIGHTVGNSIAAQVTTLRQSLLAGLKGENSEERADDRDQWFGRAARGELPFLVEVAQADAIISLISLKKDIGLAGGKLNMVVVGGAEAYLIADSLVEADVPVIVSPARHFPDDWDSYRALAGPPLSRTNLIGYLHQAGVKVALGTAAGMREPRSWKPQALVFDMAWAQLESSPIISRAEAISFITTRLEALLDLNDGADEHFAVGCRGDFVAWEGDIFEFGAKPKVFVEKDRGVDIMY